MMMGAERLEGWVEGGLEAGWLDEGRAPLRGRPAKVLGWGLRLTEALSLSARLIGDLPLPPSLALHLPGVPGIVRVELDPARAAAARRGGDLVLDREEWSAVVVGAEADRLWPVDLAGLCRRKRSDPSFRIDAESALAGAQPDPRESWSVARVLSRVGAELLSIELERR